MIREVVVSLDHVEAVGRRLAEGAVQTALRWDCILFAVSLLLAVVANAVKPWDATDDAAFGQRSNLRLRRDHGTGCQYLESRSGALTPRLGRDGKQVCE